MNAPGLHQLDGRKTLLDVLSMGGGLKSDAGYSITITRSMDYGVIPLPGAAVDPASRTSEAEVDLSSLMSGKNPSENIAICPHDILTVPRGELVYVVGEVKKPGGFVLNQHSSMTVPQAISLAEGTLNTGSLSKSLLLRKEGNGHDRTEIPLDVKRILKGSAPDISMSANDVLYVPTNKPRAVALKALDTALFAGSGVLIYRR